MMRFLWKNSADFPAERLEFNATINFPSPRSALIMRVVLEQIGSPMVEHPRIAGIPQPDSLELADSIMAARSHNLHRLTGKWDFRPFPGSGWHHCRLTMKNPDNTAQSARLGETYGASVTQWDAFCRYRC
ncbi:hypothetical protein Zmor_009446 [Zophobas morio]|uniref:Uncharacterized protein n=1 Tax=Zophobas morio TaxID=2755281 RepID=A0AA38IQP0_9CUCU|nr:hypothetical protein Zmor_009446 [Zophobas morio]